jgi:ferric-dicitrate binding protein FerR (iron transport regulator)
MNHKPPPNPSSKRPDQDAAHIPGDPKLQRVERLLAQAGQEWRCSARARGISAEKADRVVHAVLRAAEGGQPEETRRGVDFWSWLRSVLRPVSYGIAGAAVVAIWFLGIQPSRRPVGETLYHSAGAVSAIPPSSGAALARGTHLRVESAPGTLLQMDHRAQVLLKPGSHALAESRNRIVLTEGAAWIFLSGKGRDFHVDTPHGRVTATGTIFGVEAGRALEVEVLEGTVRVGTGATAFQAGEGQRLRVNAPGATATLLAGTAQTPAWAENLLDAYRKAFFERYFPSATPPNPPTRTR